MLPQFSLILAVILAVLLAQKIWRPIINKIKELETFHLIIKIGFSNKDQIKDKETKYLP